MAKPPQKSLYALNALNFFMADVNGLGPYLGVYLQQQHWSPGPIGIAMTIGGLAAMAATTPFGALIDRTEWKRAVIAISAIATVVASFAILLSSSFPVVVGSQTATGIAAAAIGPAIAGVTLGIVRQQGYAHQLGRNEAFNHAGNITAAALVGLLGYRFGLWVAFVVMAGMAVFSLIAVSMIDAKDISHRAARGMAKKQSRAAGFDVLLKSKPLIVVALTLMLFHLSNAAMLPLLGQSLAASGAADPSASMSSSIIIAQCTMIPVAIFAAWLADKRGFWLVMVIALVALPVRGLLAWRMASPLGIIPIQILDGIGAGVIGVAMPGLVARILRGSGRINVGLGAVMTLASFGISISPGLGGMIAQHFGYGAAFLALGLIACAALLVWTLSRVMLTESAAAKFDSP